MTIIKEKMSHRSFPIPELSESEREFINNSIDSLDIEYRILNSASDDLSKSNFGRYLAQNRLWEIKKESKRKIEEEKQILIKTTPKPVGNH